MDTSHKSIVFSILALFISISIILILILLKINKRYSPRAYSDLHDYISKINSNPVLFIIALPFIWIGFIIGIKENSNTIIETMKTIILALWGAACSVVKHKLGIKTASHSSIKVGQDGFDLQVLKDQSFRDIRSKLIGDFILHSIYSQYGIYYKIFTSSYLYNFDANLYSQSYDQAIVTEYGKFTSAIFEHKPNTTSLDEIVGSFVTIMTNQIMYLALFYIRSFIDTRICDLMNKKQLENTDEKVDEINEIIDKAVEVYKKTYAADYDMFVTGLHLSLTDIDYTQAIKTALTSLNDLTPSNCIAHINELRESIKIAENSVGTCSVITYKSYNKLNNNDDDLKRKIDKTDIDKLKNLHLDLTQEIEKLLVKKYKLFTALYAYRQFYKSDFL